MMWTFNSANGDLIHSGALMGKGYSGNGAGYLNPLMAHVPDVGPIPSGYWLIGSFFDDPHGKGPLVCRLTPEPESKTYGRSGFMIHGDNHQENHSASEGCIVLPYTLRKLIKDSDDFLLCVP